MADPTLVNNQITDIAAEETNAPEAQNDGDDDAGEASVQQDDEKHD